MGFTSDACCFLLMKTLLIKKIKKERRRLKNEAGGDEKHVFFLLGLNSLCYLSTFMLRNTVSDPEISALHEFEFEFLKLSHIQFSVPKTQ